MAQQRLDKILANLGLGSRKEVASMIRAAKVTVNGTACKSQNQKIDPEKDEICVSGKAVSYQAALYFMMNKPAGVITATQDNFQPTVLSLLPESLQKAGLFPIGRLDKDTEGLLILTTDGALGHALTAPRRQVDKVYYAEAAGTLAEDAGAQFAAGIVLADGTRCLPAELQFISRTEDGARVRVTLREGKFHQVKRMIRAVGGEVTYLRRESIGRVALDPSLALGTFRALDAEEINALRAAISSTKM